MSDIFEHETDCMEEGGNGCERKSQIEKAKTLWGLSLVRALRQQDLLIRRQY